MTRLRHGQPEQSALSAAALRRLNRLRACWYRSNLSHHRWLEELGIRHLCCHYDDAPVHVAQAIIRNHGRPRGEWCSCLWASSDSGGVPLGPVQRQTSFKHGQSGTAGLPNPSSMVKQLGIRQIFVSRSQGKGGTTWASTGRKLITALRTGIPAPARYQPWNTSLRFLPRFNAISVEPFGSPTEEAWPPTATQNCLGETIQPRSVIRARVPGQHGQIRVAGETATRPAGGQATPSSWRWTNRLPADAKVQERLTFRSPSPRPRCGGSTNPSSVGYGALPNPSPTFPGHLNGAHRSLLDYRNPPVRKRPVPKEMGIRARRGAGKPVRHSLHRTSTPAQRCTLGGVQKAKRQGLSSARPRASWECHGLTEVRPGGASSHQMLSDPPKTCQRRRSPHRW